MHKPVNVVKRKVKNLRSAYLLEKKKVDESMKRAPTSGKVHCPCLFYFEKMRFLDDIVILRKPTENKTNGRQESITTSEIEFKQILSSESFSNEILDSAPGVTDCVQNKKNSVTEEHFSEKSFPCEESTADCITFGPIKRSRTEEKEDTLDVSPNNKVLDYANDNYPIYTCFAKSIELQLSHLPIVLAVKAMAEMQNILANYMGKSYNNNNSNNENEHSLESNYRRKRK